MGESVTFSGSDQSKKPPLSFRKSLGAVLFSYVDFKKKILSVRWWEDFRDYDGSLSSR